MIIIIIKLQHSILHWNTSSQSYTGEPVLSVPQCSLLHPTVCIVRRTFRVHQIKLLCKGPVAMAATQLLFPWRTQQLPQAGVHMCFSCTDRTFLGHQIVFVSGKQHLERDPRKRWQLSYTAGHTDLMNLQMTQIVHSRSGTLLPCGLYSNINTCLSKGSIMTLSVHH